ncbi:MAG: glycosyltransferase [bacterium]
MNLYYFIDSIKEKKYSSEHHTHSVLEQIILRYGRRDKKYDKTVYKDEEFDINIYSLHISPELLDAELHFDKKSTTKSRTPLFIRKVLHSKLKFPLMSSIKPGSIAHYFNVPVYSSAKKVKIILELANIKELIAPEFFKTKSNLFNHIKLVNAADIIISHSEYMAKQLASRLFIDESKIKIIPRGIRCDYMEYDVEPYKLPQKFILFAGKIEPYKNLEKLFEVFNKVNIKDTWLIVAGETPGPYMESLKKMVKTETESRIKFIGYVNRTLLPSIMKKAIALVDPSHINDFPDTIIEAQNVSLPVIASRIEANTSICKDSVLYFSSISEKEMAEAIITIISNEKTRQFLIKAGKINSEKYHWDNIATMYRDLYKSL